MDRVCCHGAEVVAATVATLLSTGEEQWKPLELSLERKLVSYLCMLQSEDSVAIPGNMGPPLRCCNL